MNLNWLGHLSRSRNTPNVIPLWKAYRREPYSPSCICLMKNMREENGARRLKGSGSRIHGVFAEGVEGMDNDRKAMLMNIMAEEFTAIEFNLYLNTHPDDRKALNDFNETVKKLNDLKAQYEKRYGPLTNFGFVTSEYPWQWIDEPWPWEINFA